MERAPFHAPTASGDLVGWMAGDGPSVLALHGGPGLSFTYLDPAVEEVAAEFRVATFQQRGLAPSTVFGPFTIDQAVADVAAVLDFTTQPVWSWNGCTQSYSGYVLPSSA